MREKKNKIAKFIGVAALVIIAAASYFRYSELNAPGKQYKVHEQILKCGEVIEDQGLILTFHNIRSQKKYDKDYHSDVYRYEIDYEADNIGEETVNLENLFSEKFIVVSAGQKWRVDLLDGDISSLKANQKTKGWLAVEAVKDENIAEEKYKEFQMYYVQREENGAFIYQIMES